MPMTGLQVNWDAVAFGSTQIDRVTNVATGMNAQNIRWKADTARFAQVIVNVDNTPTATVTSGNVGLIMGLPINSQAQFTATHLDARGEVGGNIVYVMDAICTGVDGSGAHAAFGTAQATFEGVSPDGVTNPLAFTRT